MLVSINMHVLRTTDVAYYDDFLSALRTWTSTSSTTTSSPTITTPSSRCASSSITKSTYDC